MLLTNLWITGATVVIAVALSGLIVALVTRDADRRRPDPTTAATVDRRERQAG